MFSDGAGVRLGSVMNVAIILRAGSGAAMVVIWKSAADADLRDCDDSKAYEEW